MKANQSYRGLPPLAGLAPMDRAMKPGLSVEECVRRLKRYHYAFKRLHFAGAPFPYLMIRLGIPVDEALARYEAPELVMPAGVSVPAPAGTATATLKVKLDPDLQMTFNDAAEEDEEEEEGIDILVSLPHKKIKGLQMLSGGERALTSIALLFAISQVNPPPFMVLDETDAALDEANSRKYGDMIENLSKYSQLILITHNRETMARAGAHPLISVKWRCSNLGSAARLGAGPNKDRPSTARRASRPSTHLVTDPRIECDPRVRCSSTGTSR